MKGPITPQRIKELRDLTGVGVSQCRDALEQAHGDLELATSILRKMGVDSGAKKADRATKEGSIAHNETHGVIAFAEVNAETDFVAKNETFLDFCKKIAEEVALSQPASVAEFLSKPYSKDSSLTVDQLRNLLIQTIGENIVISRIGFWKRPPEHAIGIYSHMGGKILALVELSGTTDTTLAREIAMHVAAHAPAYLGPNDIPQDVIEEKKAIARSQVTDKPAHVMEKIIEGKLRAFFEENCLLKQRFVREEHDMTIEELIKHRGKESGHDIQVVRFLRWAVGQGIA